RISCDRDGYLSRLCATCDQIFKVKPKRDGTDALVFCPYCAYRPSEGWQAWLTNEQSNYLEAVTMGLALDLVGRVVTEAYDSDAHWSIEPRLTPPWQAPAEPAESEAPMAVSSSRCCRALVKHNGCMGELFCIACGEKGRTVSEKSKRGSRRGTIR